MKIGNTLICYVYLQHANSSYISLLLRDPVVALESDIDTYSLIYHECNFALIGDMNAHCMASVIGASSQDDRIDGRGRQLVELCQTKNMRILNGTNTGNSGATLICIDVSSIIDYAIISPDLDADFTVH